MKRIKKLAIGIAAVAVLGTGYFLKTTDYRKIPDIARIFNRVVLHRQNYESTLLEELVKTNDENIAEMMIDTGYVARKRINAGRKPLKEFSQNPYDLRINIEHTTEGDEAYLIDLRTGEKLPIYADNYVGGIGHNIAGVYNGAEREVCNLFDEIQETTSKAIDSIVKKLEE